MSTRQGSLLHMYSDRKLLIAIYIPGVPQKTPQTSVSLSANPTTIPEVCGVFCGTPGRRHLDD